MNRLRINTLAYVCALLVVPMTFAQGGPVLRVQIAGGRTTFRVGERIPLELSFTAAEEKRYEISNATSDRSGREHYEEFKVSPGGGWVDPLARYFARGYMGGGMSGIEELSAKPTELEVDLNQWVRFDQPGSYTVTVSSTRVVDLKRSDHHGMSGRPIDAANPISVQIVAATKEWQAEKLAAILDELKAEPETMGVVAPGRVAAVADLRYLGTRAAVDVLVANLREDRMSMMPQSAFGLMGLPESMREMGLEAMERAIDDPHFPVCTWFLDSLPTVEELGDAPVGNGIDERYGQLWDKAWQRVLAGLARKDGKARAETAQTLTVRQPDHLSAEAKASLGAVLGESFLDLTENQQTMQLEYSWDALRSEAMLPALRDRARLSLTNLLSQRTNVYSRRELKAAALHRWYELDPEGATREIVAEVGSETPLLTGQSLFYLPEKSAASQTLSQYEEVWAQRLVESNDEEEEAVLAGLMVRFGRGTAASQVAGKLNSKVGAWACAPQAAALAYLVRFDPDSVKPLLPRAIHGGTTGCSHSLFQDVSAHASGAVLTDAAMAALDDADNQTLMDALLYIAWHGRKEDERPIQERYSKWIEMWAGKAEVLESQDRETAQKNNQEIWVGAGLGRALIANQGWLADDQLIASVVKSCVGEQMCQQMKQLALMATAPLHVSLYQNETSENYQVGQYDVRSITLLGEKIEQYPKGTVFTLSAASPDHADQMASEKEARTLFAEKGMTVVAPVP